jgi:periplasmic protein TonB
VSTHKLPLSAPPSPHKITVVPKPQSSNVQNDTFLSAMLEMPSAQAKRSHGPLKMFASVLIHAGVLALLIFLPLYFARHVIAPPKPPAVTYVFTPPPPAPPPSAAATRAPRTAPVQTPVPKITEPTPLVAPRVIPRQAPEVSNTVAPPELNQGVAGGVEGGVPGGVLGGVLGGTGTIPGPPTPEKSPGIVRVGGNVKPPQLVQKVQPQYPTVARMAHVQGQVIIDAVISKNGNVISEHAVSGPSLLVPSALDAVKQWKYKPTYLNGQPVDLAMQVTVEFQLGA